MTACTAIERLRIELSVNVNLQARQIETFNRFSRWLGDCKQLKELSLINIESALSAVVPTLLDENTSLEKLTLNAENAPFFTPASEAFNYALTHQRKLVSLVMRGDGEDSTEEQMDRFVESVAQLVRLRKLELHSLMENFQEDQTLRMLLSLTLLEELFIGGYYVTDDLLQSLSGQLRYLKRWTIMAASNFTVDGLLSFIDALDEFGNDGLVLSVDFADPDYALTSEEQVVVRSAMTSKVGGSFEYVLIRELDASDDELYGEE